MGCFGVPRCHETAGNKEKQGERDKDIEKEETKNATKTATILWRFLLAIFDYKTGDFLRFWPFLRPPIEVTAIYIYIYVCMYVCVHMYAACWLFHVIVHLPLQNISPNSAPRGDMTAKIQGVWLEKEPDEHMGLTNVFIVLSDTSWNTNSF